MKVFLWKKYGSTEIYLADNSEQLKHLLNEIIECIEDDEWGLTSRINEVKKKVSQDSSECFEAINYLLRSVWGSGHELAHDEFEYSTGFYDVREFL